MALTGTPIENGPRDLWAIMEYLNPGMLGTLKQYVTNVASPIEHGNGRNHREEPRKKIQPFILRRKKTDEGIASELPDKIEQRLWCSLTREQAGWYRAALNNASAALDSSDLSERRGAILKLLGELKQICNGISIFQKDGSTFDNRSGKLQLLRDKLIEVLENNEKAIVFSQYPSHFDKLDDYLTTEFDKAFAESESGGRKVGLLSLTGKDSIKDRESMQQNFENDPRFPVMLISLKAGGTGLNLQTANLSFISIDGGMRSSKTKRLTEPGVLVKRRLSMSTN